MFYKDLLLKYSHKLYRSDEFIKDLYAAIGAAFDSLQADTAQVVANSLISSADLATVEMYEQHLNIKADSSKSLQERREIIIAKLRGNTTFNLAQLQAVCDSWKNGEITADFKNGKIKLTFVGEYGIPSDLAALKEALDEVKPAHLAIDYGFRYLLIKEIHNVMTLNQLEAHQLNEFAGGA